MREEDGGPPTMATARIGSRVLSRARTVRGPRDRTYRGYSVRENPWLQLQGCVRLSEDASRVRRAYGKHQRDEFLVLAVTASSLHHWLIRYRGGGDHAGHE